MLKIVLLVLFISLVQSQITEKNFKNLRFPKDFTFGTATASYQIEGAWNKGGRAPSIWDTFSQTPGKVYRNQNGNIACDHYHKYKEDIQLMKNLGVKHYRLSISWSRLLPTGRLPINSEGLRFYNNLIDELLRNGIEPHITLYHWDLPQALHDEYKGWLNRRIVNDFRDYADVCFRLFGGRVKNWITINEPFIVTNLGYNVGIFAPGRCSDRNMCPQGNSTSEPWIVTHHMLLAHAHAYRRYDSTYRSSQKGVIGITLNGDHAEPSDINSEADKRACERKLIFDFGWFADPIYTGDYPALLQKIWGPNGDNVLPQFTAAEKRFIKGTNDFFGLNTYTSVYVKHENSGGLNYGASAYNKTGHRVGKLYTPSWLSHVPWGIRKLLSWLGNRYNDPNIIITENGCGDRLVNEHNFHPTDGMSLEKVQLVRTNPLNKELNDTHRIAFYSGYLQSVSDAIYKDGVKISGYFAWSFMDNFEWADGYSIRFGLHYVDYSGGLKRYQKDSAKWWKALLQSRRKKLK